MLVKIGNACIDPAEIVFIGDEHADIDGTHYITVRFRGGGRAQIFEATMDEAEAALIDAGVIEESTYDELPELTEEEDAKAQALFDAGYKYLARDEDCKLYAYKFEPVENQGFYMPGSSAETAERIDSLFDFIAPGGCCPIAGLLLPY